MIGIEDKKQNPSIHIRSIQLKFLIQFPFNSLCSRSHSSSISYNWIQFTVNPSNFCHSMSQFQIKSYNSRSPISDSIPSFKCPRRIQFTFTPLNAELQKQTNSNIPLLMLCSYVILCWLSGKSYISVFSYCAVVEMQTV